MSDEIDLAQAFDDADAEMPDKSTEFLLAYTADMNNVDYMDVVDALSARHDEESSDD